MLIDKTVTGAFLRRKDGSFVSVVVISCVGTRGYVVCVFAVHQSSSCLGFTISSFGFCVPAHASDRHDDNLVVDESTGDQQKEADDFLPDERLPADAERHDPNEKSSGSINRRSLSCSGVLRDGHTRSIEGSN